jgi:hypothetical protein
VRDTSPAPPLPLLVLCGSELRKGDAPGTLDTLCLDRWLVVRVAPPVALQCIVQLRARVEALVARVVAAAGDGREARAAGGGEVEGVVRGIVALDGAGGGVDPAAPKKKKSKAGGKGKGTQKRGGGSRGGAPFDNSFFASPYHNATGVGGLFDY